MLFGGLCCILKDILKATAVMGWDFCSARFCRHPAARRIDQTDAALPYHC